MLPPASAMTRGDLREAARDVRHVDPQAHEAPVAHQPAHQHRGEHAAVDIAARDRNADAPSGEARAVLEQGGEPRGAGAFGHGLLDLDQRDHRALDGFLLDDQHLLDERADDGEGARSHVLHRDALGDGVAAALDRQAGEALVHRGIVPRFDAEDADRGLERLGGGGDPGDEAAAADGHDDELEIGQRLRASRGPRSPARR